MSNQAAINQKQLPDLDLAATGNSEVIRLDGITDCAIQITWTSTGSPVGTVTLEGCISPGTGGANFTTITTGSIASPNNNSGTTCIVLTGCQYPLVRVHYARSSGSGIMNIWAHAKSQR